MRKFKNCEIFAKLWIVAMILSQFVTEAEKTCSIVSLLPDEACGENETCIAVDNQTGECRCSRNYQRLDDKCVPVPTTTEPPIYSSTFKEDSEESSSGGSVAAGLLIPLFLISLAVILFMSARRYKWVQRFRQYQQNRYGNVLVTRDQDDDDDDDPPIV